MMTLSGDGMDDTFVGGHHGRELRIETVWMIPLFGDSMSDIFVG